MATKCTTFLLKSLRSVMKNSLYVSQNIEAYIVPSCDSHQSEYIASSDERRAFITGFTGSAGTAVITEKEAALWTDGRYFLQAQQQLDSNWQLMKDGLPDTPTQGSWLSKVLPVGSRVGVDPFLMSFDSWELLSSELEAVGHSLVAVHQNLVDIIWMDKPLPPMNLIVVLPLEYTGMTWQEKVAKVRADMIKKNASALILTALDEIAWLFNLRGSDIEYNPVFFAYAVVTLDSIHLFVDECKLTPAVTNALEDGGNLKLELHPYHSIKDFVSLIVEQHDKIWINKKSSYALVSVIPKTRQLLQANPVVLRKAVKNDIEISCMQNAHVKDAVAVCEFFCWLSDAIVKENITEISAAEKLESFRSMQKDYVGPSFETISASGPNAAIIHYKPTSETDRAVTKDEMYLCDSGGQYRDGTTDITRTWHFGIPTAYEKECYTRVVKGHIALASAVFPNLTKGQMLDTLARKALWDAGLDYLHGTGHGVGVYLNVHEGPMGISWRPHPDDPGIQKGMILSIEPGYYEEEKFGVRIENLALVCEAKTKYNFKNRGYVTFTPLTLVPFQTKLLDPSMLTSDEIQWLNSYHLSCREIIGKSLEEQNKHHVLQWLLEETQPLG